MTFRSTHRVRCPMDQLTPERLLHAYRNGIFPMPDPEDGGQISWYLPAKREIVPLEDFHIPHDLARLVRQQRFEVAVDQNFEAVVRCCADCDSTWISEEIVVAFIDLYRLGYGHSVECRQQGRLVGGLYGVTVSGVFFGESMFYRGRGFVLLDTQFLTPHLERFGAIEIDRNESLR